MKCLITCNTLIVLVFLAIGQMHSSEGFSCSIHGHVTTPQGEDSSSVSIILRSRKGTNIFVTRTGFKGEYRFDGIHSGEYLIEAIDVSSTFGASESIVLRVGEDLSHDIHLKVRGTPTDIQVTASGIPQISREVAKSADAIDGSEIRNRAEYAISEVIRNIPGVRVKQSGGPGSFTSIQVRGLRPYDTSLLIDGLRLRDAAGTQGSATSFYENLLVLDTERVEFLRGSGSSVYGSHAMGGVINLSSRTGGGATRGKISIEAGGLGFTRSLARINGGLGGADRFVYSGGVAHTNVSDGVDGFDPYRNSSGHGSARYSFTPSLSLSARIWITDAYSALNESPTFDPLVLKNHPVRGAVTALGLAPDQLANFSLGRPFDAQNATFIQGFNDPDSYRDSSFMTGAFVLQHELSAHSSYRISYHGVDTGRAFRDGPGGRSIFDPSFTADSRFDGRIDTVTAMIDHHMGSHLFGAGYEYEQEQYFNFNTDENPIPALRPESTSHNEQSSHTIFSKIQFRLADRRLQVGLSGRLQKFSLGQPTFSGDANPYVEADLESAPTASTVDSSIAYLFRSSNTKIRSHLGNSYRSPSSFERFGASFFGGFASFWGDPRLRPERSVAVDGGVDQWLFGSKLRLSGTYFYTALKEVIIFDFGVIDPMGDPFGRFGGYRNTGGGLARGLEISASAALNSSFNLVTSYTYTDSLSRTPTVPGERFFRNLGVSSHMFSLMATQRFGKRFDVTFDFFSASDYALRFFGSDRRLVFEGPVKADLVASYVIPFGEHKELHLFGKAENIFGQKYFENGFQSPGLWATGGLNVRF